MLVRAVERLQRKIQEIDHALEMSEG